MHGDLPDSSRASKTEVRSRRGRLAAVVLILLAIATVAMVVDWVIGQMLLR